MADMTLQPTPAAMATRGEPRKPMPRARIGAPAASPPAGPARDRRPRPGPGHRCRGCHKYRRLQEAHQALLTEMAMAEQVQRSLLPCPLPAVPGVRFAFGYRPTRHMGGDFLNVFRLDRERVGLYVGDVMGHGPAAALLSVFAMHTLRPKTIAGDSYQILLPARVLEGLNRALLDADIPGQPFLTMVYGVLDTTDRTWTYCCGGHPYPMILRDQAPRRFLPSTGPLLGVTELPFHQDRVALEPGDRLVLYSDGAQVASWGPHGVGLDGLASRLRPQPDRSVDDLIEGAIASVRFEARMADDVALLVAEITA